MDKVRENRMRRIAAREGYRMVRARGPTSQYNKGGYMLAPVFRDATYGSKFELSLDDVERILFDLTSTRSAKCSSYD